MSKSLHKLHPVTKNQNFHCVKWKAYKIMTVQQSANWISKKETAAKSKLFNGDGSPQK